jgi:predicted ATPase
MLKKIRLTNFKSFVDEEVEVAPLTLLVGANASGKSNFLDAIRFLQGLTLDLTVREVLDGEEKASSDAWPGIRGSSQEAAWRRASSFSIESTWCGPSAETRGLYGDEIGRIEQEPQLIDITHGIVCRTSPVIVCESEWIERGGVRMPSPFKDDQKSILGATNFFRLVSESRKPLQGIQPLPLRSLRFAVEGARFLDIPPAAMREYGRRGAPLGNEGKNFSGVLADLSEDPIVKHSFVTWLREVCAPEIEDLDFVEVKDLGDVMAFFVEKGGTRISARSLSDGTLRFLGALLALQTARSGDVLLIEEIGEGLHPTRIQFLRELLESAVRQRNVQVIATTHSPVVLQWLAPERLREVIVFGRMPDRPESLMRRLGEVPYFEEVIQREEIDELFSSGWLESALACVLGNSVR